MAKCLEHLVNQTYRNIEIIIVDDGSKDKSVDVCKRYAENDARIKLFSQENSGPAVALNRGMDAASGQYVHFHDADDYVNLDYYEKMAAVAMQTDADVLCGEVNQPEYQFPKFDAIEISVAMEDKIKTTRANDFNPAWRYLYKKDFLKEQGLRFETNTFHNWDWLLTKSAVILAHKCATVPGAVYNVVDVPTSMGKKANLRPDKPGAADAYRRYNDLLHKHGATELMRQTYRPYHTSVFKMFNRTIARKDIWPNKTRYYLFGINIGTRYRK